MENIYNYYYWLIGFSIFFVIWERLFPLEKRPFWRREWYVDVFYIVFHSRLFGELLALLFVLVPALNLGRQFDEWVLDHDLHEVLYRNWVSGLSFWPQFGLAVLVLDLCKYLIHNTLHRVPWLWEFHKVHHSIVDLDWIGNWRFHWFEAIFYNSLLVLPVILFGFNPYALFWYGIVGTFVGHFAHANVRFRLGPLKYVFNSPEMHIWHHIHPDHGPINRNFGIVLSLWDWMFQTAYLPHRKAERLGFAAMEQFPRSLWKQMLIPVTTLFSRFRRAGKSI
ncbi:MAG: sterol desaturase family protein [Blastocatellia bacterium]|nr:sterol desaturase family protein [Blastocatellia bacterium]